MFLLRLRFWLKVASLGLVLSLVGIVLAVAGLAGLVSGGAVPGASSASIQQGTVPAHLVPLFEKAAGICPAVSAPLLAGVARVESGFQADAVGPPTRVGRAQGMMQFMAPAWAHYGRDEDGDGVADPFSPADAIPATARYLCALDEILTGVPGQPVALMLSGYNAGEGAVRRFGGVVPGTREYVATVQRFAAEFSAPVNAAALSGGPVASVLPGPGGWANPAVGRLSSPFGWRIHPVLGTRAMHAGEDVAAPCGSPVYAATGGMVVWAGGAYQGRTGNQLVVSSAGGLTTRYGHLLSGTVRVRQGDTVRAGQHIASVGGDKRRDPRGAGNSTGCHLHFEVNLGERRTPTDPVAFLRARGVTLGRG